MAQNHQHFLCLGVQLGQNFMRVMAGWPWLEASHRLQSRYQEETKYVSWGLVTIPRPLSRGYSLREFLLAVDRRPRFLPLTHPMSISYYSLSPGGTASVLPQKCRRRMRQAEAILQVAKHQRPRNHHLLLLLTSSGPYFGQRALGATVLGKGHQSLWTCF